MRSILKTITTVFLFLGLISLVNQCRNKPGTVAPKTPDATGIAPNDTSSVSGQIETIADIDGNVYKTILIGNQIWMAENLSATSYDDGKSIPLVKEETVWAKLTTPACCWYKNEEDAFKSTYGALYNWYAVNTGKLCPKGWHVPGDSEWTILANYLGGESLAGGKMKESGVTYWVEPNQGASNSSGFTALPGGFRYSDGKFFDFGFSGYWWSSSQYNATNAYFRFLYFEDMNMYRFDNNKKNGFSVRCLKD